MIVLHLIPRGLQQVIFLDPQLPQDLLIGQIEDPLQLNLHFGQDSRLPEKFWGPRPATDLRPADPLVLPQVEGAELPRRVVAAPILEAARYA